MIQARRMIFTCCYFVVLFSAWHIVLGENEAEPVHWSPSIAEVGAKNLLPNGSFECGNCGWSSIGRMTGWGGDLCGLYGEIQAGGAWHGEHCLRVELGPGKTPVTCFAVYPAARVVQSRPLAGNVGWLRVEVGQEYTLSVYMRADREGVAARLAFYFGSDPALFPEIMERSQEVVLSREWQRYCFTVTAERPDLFAAVGPDLSAGPEESATVWMDAVQVERGGAAGEFSLREEVEIGFASGRFGNLFATTDPAVLQVYGFNGSGAEAVIAVRAELTDYFDARLPDLSTIIKIPARKNIKTDMPLGIPGTGFYRVKLFWEIGKNRHVEETTLAVTPRYAGKDSPFGINHAMTTPELCRSLQRAGVVWARDWSLDWNQVEREEGNISFAGSDAQIDRVLEYGMSVTSLLPPFASAIWASSAPADVEQYLPANFAEPLDFVKMGYAPKDPQKLYDFIYKTAEHYRSRVKVWEFYNEPVHTIYSLPSANTKLPGANYTVADYVKLLKGAYRAMKSADPGCRVMGGISVGSLEAIVAGARELVELGGLEALDIYAVHPYGHLAGSPEEFAPFFAKMNEVLVDQNGKGVPLWATEFGYYGADEKPLTPWIAPRNYFSANVMRKSEKEAADYSVRAAVIMLAHRVEKIFYHQGVEAQLNNNCMTLECPFFGPLGTPRKVFVAQAVLADLLGPAPRLAGVLKKPERIGETLTGEVYGYAFQGGGKAVLVAWAPEINQNRWALELSGKSDTRPIHVFNLAGGELANNSIDLGESPVYIVTREQNTQDLLNAFILLLPK